MTNFINRFKSSSNPAPVRRSQRRPARWITIANTFVSVGTVFAFVAFSFVHEYRQEWAAEALIRAIADGYHAAMTEDVRAAAETETWRQFTDLRTALYCEAPRLEGNDPAKVEAEMAAIADVVYSRIDSPNFPDTIVNVVEEVRTDAISHKRVAQFSSFFSPCFKGAKETAKWNMAGMQAAIAFSARWHGHKSSGNTHFVMDYAHPRWKTVDPARCLLEAKGKIGGGWHAFFAEVLPEDRANCREEQKVAAAEAIKAQLAAAEATNSAKKKAKTFTLPEGKDAPIPTPRPDEVAMLLSNS